MQSLRGVGVRCASVGLVAALAGACGQPPSGGGPDVAMHPDAGTDARAALDVARDDAALPDDVASEPQSADDVVAPLDAVDDDTAAPGLDAHSSDAPALDAVINDAPVFDAHSSDARADVAPLLDARMDAATDVVAVGDAGRIACSTTFPTEVFRDDFSGAAVDSTRWDVVQQGPGGGAFTQITAMLRSNVTVAGGVLHVASRRHCANPYPSGAPVHPAACGGTTYYSGGWLRSNGSYAPGRGLAMFLARVPTPVRGTFPGLWLRNTDGATNYGELDLIEQWWDGNAIGRAGNFDQFSTTTWIGDMASASTQYHTSGNLEGPYTGLNAAFHVWEVEWDAAVPSITYYYRDAPGATRQLMRRVDATTPGLSGNVSSAHLAAVLALGWRPYIDFAVQPQTAYHYGPDTPPPAVDPYDPADLLVDSVVVCAP